LNALHRDPAHKWTLATLAACAHMSRSAFAPRFKTLVGQAPLDYLTRWRMLLAADRLLLAREPIAVIAPAVGYASESAFSTAFRRVMGCSPREYRQREAIRKSS
jgi:AraC-like DNA-binding protein